MGLCRRLPGGLPLHSFLLAGVSDRQDSGGPLRAVSRAGTHRHDRADRLHAHGGLAGTDADDRTHLAIHVLREIESGHLPARYRHPDQHRAAAGEARTGQTGPAGGSGRPRRFGGAAEGQIMMNRILIAGGGTGGHLMPALAIASAIRERLPEIEPVLVGAVRGVEARILPTREFRFHLLPAEPIHRKAWWRNVRWPFIAGRLLREVALVFEEEQP